MYRLEAKQKYVLHILNNSHRCKYRNNSGINRQIYTVSLNVITMHRFKCIQRLIPASVCEVPESFTIIFHWDVRDIPDFRIGMLCHQNEYAI